VNVTFKGPACYTMVDQSDSGGAGIADLVDSEVRVLLPACQDDDEGTFVQRREVALIAAEHRATLHALHKG
ncbi:MAG: hypothetical protein WCI73_13165, partial [Phycisphaerae bacterium]